MLIQRKNFLLAIAMLFCWAFTVQAQGPSGALSAASFVSAASGDALTSYLDSDDESTAGNCQALFTYQTIGATAVSFTNASNPSFGANYYWNFGDGNTSSQNSPLHSYSQGGLYLVCLTIYDSLSNCQDTYCDSVYVQGSSGTCNAAFGISYSGSTVNFNDQSSSSPSPIASWSWDFGDGTFSSTQNPSHNYVQGGLYNVCLTIFTFDSCQSTVCQQVQASGGGGGCQAYFTYTQNSFNMVSFNNGSQASGGANYYWDFGDGGNSSATNPTHSYNQGGFYVVCLTVYDSLSNCQDTYCDTVNVQGGGGSQCNAAFNVSYSGSTVLFGDQSSSSPSPITNWYWDFGDGGTSNAQNPSHNYSQSGLYTVCLTIETADSCVSTTCQQVQASGSGGSCTAYFTYTQTSGNSFSFQNGSTGGGQLNYSWSFGDGSWSGAQNPSHTYSQGGLYLVCLTIYDSLSGCQDTYCDSLYVQGGGGSQCNAAFNVSYSGNTVVFNDQSTSSPSSIIFWTWDFGDGNISTLQNPSHNYATAGLYNVCLTIQTGDSCISTTCQQVQASGGGGACQAYFTYQQNSGNSFAFQDGSTGGSQLNYSWSFGDGNWSGAQNPSHTYSQGGLYLVCLTIYDSLSGCQDTYCDSLFVQGGGGVSCNAAFNVNYNGTTVLFTDVSTSSPGPVIWWSWSFGDGNTSNQPNPSHVYAQPGVYTVCLTIETADSCMSTICQQVQASGSGGNCQASFTYQQNAQNTVTFTNTSQPPFGTTSFWDFGDGGTSNQANPSHTYNQGGLYIVCLTIFDSLNLCQDTYCDTVNVQGGGGGCQAYFTSNATGGNTVSFTNGSTGGGQLNYSWSFGDGNGSNATNPTHTYNQGGLYTVCLTIWDSLSGCQDTYCDSVYVQGGGGSQCNANFSFSYSGNAVNFFDQSSSSPSPIINWYWDFGDGNTSFSQNPTHTYNAGGLYTVCLTIETADSCMSTVCQPVQANGGGVPQCNANFTWTYSGNTVVFTDQSTSSPSPVWYWYWDFGDGNTSNAQNPSHNYATGGLYNVCLTIETADSCQSTVCYQLQANGGGGNCTASFTVNPDTTGQYAYILTNTSSSNGFLNYFWDFGDGGTSTSAYPTHQYNGPGTYLICLTVFDSSSNCQDTYCDTISISPNQNPVVLVQSPNTSVAAPLASNLTLFPNPVQDQLGLKLGLTAGADVRVIVVDMRGKILLQRDTEAFPAGEHVIRMNTESLADGLYMTQVQIGAEVITKKLIIRN